MRKNNQVGSEAAKTLVREYFQRLLNQKDVSVCDEMLSSQYTDHDAPPNVPPGPENTKEFVTMFLNEYPDMHIDIEDLIAEGYKVAARIVWHGSNKESGKVFHQMGIVILHLDDKGKFMERWSAYKTL